MMKWLLGVVVIFMIIVSMGYLYYEYGEREAYRQMSAGCELRRLSILLNENFDKTGSYPDTNEWLKRNSSEIDKIRCGRRLSIDNGSLVDPWGNTYRYFKVSDSSIVLYSVKMEDMKFQSEYGELLRGHSKEKSP